MARNTKPSDAYREVDESLRKAYEGLLNEDLPDRFKTLINQLRGDTKTIQQAAPDKNADQDGARD